MKILNFNRFLLCLCTTTLFLFSSCSSDDGGSDDGSGLQGEGGDRFTSVVIDDSLLLDGNPFIVSPLQAIFQTNDGKADALFSLPNTSNPNVNYTLSISLKYDENEPLDGVYNLASSGASITKEVSSLSGLLELPADGVIQSYSPTEAQVEVKSNGNRSYTLTVSIKFESSNPQGSETPETKMITGTLTGKFITVGTHL